jgi:hypothetical protein
VTVRRAGPRTIDGDDHRRVALDGRDHRVSVQSRRKCQKPAIVDDGDVEALAFPTDIDAEPTWHR